MSRKIDITKELSDEDVAYLKSRGRGYDIERNKEFVSGARVGLRGEDPKGPAETGKLAADSDESGGAGDDPSTEGDESPVEEESTDDSEMSLDELKALAKAKGLPVSGSKTDLKERLAGA